MSDIGAHMKNIWNNEIVSQQQFSDVGKVAYVTTASQKGRRYGVNEL